MNNNLAQCLVNSCQQVPEKQIITILHSRKGEIPISYQLLYKDSIAYASSMVEMGVKPGEVIILILQHEEELVYAFWGAILCGAIPSIMPFLTEKLSPDHYRESLRSLFQITRPAAVIASPEYTAEVHAAIQEGSTVRIVIDSSEVAFLTGEEISRLLTLDSPCLAGLKQNPEDIVFLQHSSGTTGLQKGVALSHQAVFNQLDSYSKALNLNSEDTIVSWLPLYHDMGLIAGFIMPIMSRVPLVLMSPFEWVRAPHKLLQAVSKYQGTLTWLPNFAYNFCAQKIRERDLEGVNLKSLRAVINCSEPIYIKSHQMFLERFSTYGFRSDALATCYAMAENVFAVTQGGIHRPVQIDTIYKDVFISKHMAQPGLGKNNILKMVSSGTPISDVNVQVFEKETRRLLPERHVGEIVFQSNCMLTGYYNRPDATVEAFHDGWYLTGDLGYIANGEVYITGRKKDLIIVGGKNIYSRDLEIIASDIDGIHPGRVAAFGVFNDTSGTEDVVIVAEVEKDLMPNRQKIVEMVRNAINKNSDVNILTNNIHLVERGWLLKTSSGKVSRPANREKYLSEKYGQKG